MVHNIITLYLILLYSSFSTIVKGQDNDLFSCLSNQGLTIVETSIGKLTVYSPGDRKIRIVSTRPSKDDNNISFCIPAAFTDNCGEIDGIFIQDGKLIRNDWNNTLNGGLFLEPVGQIKISLVENQIEPLSIKGSFLQQALLIYFDTIIPCHLWDKKENRITQRRAIAVINGKTYIIESHGKHTIVDFQRALCEIRVNHAIYLDMGTYSYGWFKLNNKILELGSEAVPSKTACQSNWLIF